MSKGERATPAYIRMIITLLAGVLTIGLTVVAFWLSYEHLHDVAGDHGLSGERAWAWPATLDMFIVIGELLILRASLMQKIDPWSWICAFIGSVGSITLNVVGVGKDAGTLDYVIAAVPPVAALLAFGILMRQLHQAITAYVSAPPKIVPGARTVPPGVRVFEDPIDHIAAAFDVPRNLITDGMSEAEMNEASQRLLHAVAHPEEDDEDDPQFGSDAYRYVPGDEEETDEPAGQDASIEALRRASDHIDDVMRNTAHLMVVPPPPTVAPGHPGPPWRGYRADLVIHDEAFGVLGTGGDIYTAPVGTPAPEDSPGLSPGEAWRQAHPEYVLPGDVPDVPGGHGVPVLGYVPSGTLPGDMRTEDIPRGTEDTQEDVPVPVSRPVPRPRTTGTKTSAPGRVRDILGTSPGATDGELRDILKEEGFLGNTINKAIRRVREES